MELRKRKKLKNLRIWKIDFSTLEEFQRKIKKKGCKT